jgi:hypothetical protein
MSKRNLKDINIFFKVIVPQNYDEFELLFPGVFDELENPDHCLGNEGLRKLAVDFRELRKGLGLVGNKRNLFHKWLAMFLDKHSDYWELHGGTTLHYAEDENFAYGGRRWILIRRRRRGEGMVSRDPNERYQKVTYGV